MRIAKGSTRVQLEAMKRNLVLGVVIAMMGGGMSAAFSGMTDFYKMHGVTEGDVFALQGLFAMSMGICSVPLGYLADAFGKRRFLLGGAVLVVLGFLVYTVASTFEGFLVAELLIGLGGASSMGAEVAMMYGSLTELRRVKHWPCVLGKMSLGGAIVGAAAHLCGGYLAVSNYRAPFLVCAGVAFVQLLLALGFTEPRKNASRKPSPKELVGIVRLCFWEKSEVRWILLSWTVLGVGVALASWGYGSYLEGAQWKVEHRGWVFAVSSLIAGGASVGARWIPQCDKSLFMIFGLSVTGVALGHILLGSMILSWGILFALPHQVSRGATDVIFSSALNRQPIDNVRATVQSIRGALAAIVSGLLMLGLKVVSDAGGCQWVFWCLGILVLLAAAPILLLWRRNSK